MAANIFPEKTAILAPSTSASAINPSELAARGAAFQASLVQEFDAEDIEQSIHPMVTVTPHLSKAIGVEFTSNGESSFQPLLNTDTALPARRIAQYTAPKEGGDVLVRVCEGAREIKVTKPEPKAKEEKPADDEDSDFDSDEEEEEDIREIVWKTEKPVAELAVKADAALDTAREVAGALGSTPLLSVASALAFSKDGVRPDADARSLAERIQDIVSGPVVAGLHSIAASTFGL